MANLNLDEILALFENGERRYAEDPIFKSVADSLKMGLGVYAVLDHTVKEVNRLNALNVNSRNMYLLNGEEVVRLNAQIKEFEKTNCELVRIIDELENPEPEFGVCTRCGGRDDKTRVGFSECNHCYAKFP